MKRIQALSFISQKRYSPMDKVASFFSFSSTLGAYPKTKVTFIERFTTLSFTLGCNAIRHFLAPPCLVAKLEAGAISSCTLTHIFTLFHQTSLRLASNVAVKPQLALPLAVTQLLGAGGANSEQTFEFCKGYALSLPLHNPLRPALPGRAVNLAVRAISLCRLGCDSLLLMLNFFKGAKKNRKDY